MAVRVTVDGRALSVDGAPTILEVARSQGIEIPTLCQSDGHPNSVCRLCMVELDGGRAVPACSTHVKEGLAVRTDSPHLRDLRRGLLSLLLADHGPHPGSERCRLERFAREFQVKAGERLAPAGVIDTSHPAIRFDPSLCILCRKCLLACDEDQMNEVIALAGRGSTTRVAFDLDGPLGFSSCASCGACIDACPTGALLEAGWEPAERTVVTTCPYCGVGCAVEYGIAHDSVVWARGGVGADGNRSPLCVKGKFAFQHEASRDRLRMPLIRKEGVGRGPLGDRPWSDVFRTATWEEALGLVAERIRAIRDADGPSSIGGIASDRSTNEDVYTFQKLMRIAVGTDNVDQSATLCHSPSAAMLSWALGAGASTNPIADVQGARTILLVGSNTEAAHPVLGARIKRAAKDGAHLVVVDPRRLGMARHAELNLNLRPGTDVPLFSAMARYILENGWDDRAFIEARTEGFQAWQKSLEPFTVEYAARVTGLSADDIRTAARLYATETPSVIFWTLGITEHANGSDNVSALVNLALLTGNVGKPGAGLNPIRGQNNVQGGADMGSAPGSLPGYQDLFDPATRAKFEARWGRGLPESKGSKSTEMVQLARGGVVRLLYISGENSIRSHPDSASVDEAFRKLDFLVVQDLFLTETAEYADVVLPAASSFEKSGTFTNTERRVQRVRPLVPPPGEAKADWEIYAALAAKLGCPMPYEDSAQVMEEIAHLTPSYAGVSHAALDRGGLPWPVAAGSREGTPILHVGRFVRGQGRFRPIAWHEPAPTDEAAFPFVLITGRQREQYHTGTMTRRSPVVNAITRGAEIEMSPEDMASQGLADGDRVRVSSARGSVEAKVRASPTLSRGVLFTTFHYAELPVNRLTPSILDPLTRTPAYKDLRVRVEKAA